MYDPSSWRVCVSHAVVFDEQAQWNWKKEDGAEAEMELSFTIDYSVTQEPTVIEHTTKENGRWGSAIDSPVPVARDGDHGMNDDNNESGGECSVASSDLDADHDAHVPVKLRRLDDVIADLEKNEPKLHVVSYEEPATPSEAQADPRWRAAMKEELDSIEDNQTWMLCDLPQGHRVIGLKWVFKLKRNEHGAVVKYKAILVLKGYAQRRGIGYNEAFAPVARLDTVRLLIALVAHKGWEMHHLDVKSTFLIGDMLEEVFMEQPVGFIKKGSERNVLKLKKTLYGLHQAPRAWNAKLDGTLTELSFTRSPSKPSIYTRKADQYQLVMGVYVDDLVIIGVESVDIRKFKEEMSDAFKMSDLRILRYYLGIEVD
jgi:hypothetical protein